MDKGLYVRRTSTHLLPSLIDLVLDFASDGFRIFNDSVFVDVPMNGRQVQDCITASNTFPGGLSDRLWCPFGSLSFNVTLPTST